MEGTVKSSLLCFLILFTFSFSLYAQQITATLSGNTSTQAFSVLNNSSLNLFSVRGNGNVGIGTTNPQAKFELVGSDALINGLTIGRGGGNGIYNSGVGTNSLYSNTSGTYNTAFGLNSLALNTTGGANTAIGSLSLGANTIGSDNTALGFYSLQDNTEGEKNTAIGESTLSLNATGSQNTAVGQSSLYNNTIGSYNTAIGINAGLFGTNLTYGTFIGSDAYTSIDGLTNIAGYGYNSRPTSSNQVRIGNSSVTSIGGYASWTNLSDERYKLNVHENVKGLDFILKLHPVTYQLNMTKLAADLKEDQRMDKDGNIVNSSSEIDLQARYEKSQIVYTGFIAQEVEKVAKELGFEFSGIDAPKNENDFYGLRYAEFVVPLVKAVQEQQKKIEDLERRIATLGVK
jgi:hypothetical protein